jgi:hypothetical protein
MPKPLGSVARAGKQGAFIFVLLAMVGFWVAVARGDSGFQPAAPGEPTYETVAVEIMKVSTQPDGDRIALLRWDREWTSSAWPGYSVCRATVYAADGRMIGLAEFETASMIPAPPPGDVEVHLSAGPVASAEVVCDAGERPSSDAQYTFSHAEVAGTSDDPRLVFSVDWTTDQPPLYQQCIARLSRVDGGIASYEFGLSVGKGRAEVMLTPDLARSAVVAITCAPLP